MREYDFDVCLENYKKFRNDNYAVIKDLNRMRKEIRFLKQFDVDAVEQVIQGLYEQSIDLEDIGEVLGITVYDVYFILIERGLLKEREKEQKKGGVVYEDVEFKGNNLFKG